MYFALITKSGYAAKNKMAAQIEREFKKQDRMLLRDKYELYAYQDRLDAIMLQAEKDHPRCTPIEKNQYGPLSDEDVGNYDCMIYTLGGNLVITIFKVNDFKDTIGK